MIPEPFAYAISAATIAALHARPEPADPYGGPDHDNDEGDDE